MKIVHLECLPDETLVKFLGIPKKRIVHHSGKSRVFHALKNAKGQIGLVDEDPGSAKTTYEKQLKPISQENGISVYRDQNNNVILQLHIKLEDWILDRCKRGNVNIERFGLPNNPNSLHNIINSRIQAFQKLLDALDNVEQLENLKKLLN